MKNNIATAITGKNIVIEEQPTNGELKKSALEAIENIDADPTTSLSPVDQLYKNFTSVFGNSNPKQLFSMVWPGTVLDQESYTIPAGTTQGDIPTSIMIGQSTLFDQYYPIATITQPDGTRVSDRYTQALEMYGPKPNEALIDLQESIRARLDQKVDMVVDGVITKVTLLEKFSILENEFTKRKQDWGKMKADQYRNLKDGGDPDWWEEYLRWYGLIAQGYIDGINAAYNRMVADFPLNEFEDALAILDTHDAAALLRAKQDLRNGEVPAPPEVGASYYPTLAIPHDWGSVLKPSTVFTDLLASPEAQRRYMDLSIEQLRQQVFGWNAVLAQIPDTSKGEIAAALADFNTASTAYYEATNNLIATYTDNTVLAVKSYLDYKQGSDNEKLDGANKVVDNLNAENGGTSPKIDNTAKFKKIADDIGNAQKKLIGDTGSMVTAGQNLGRKATAYLQTKAGEGLRQLIQPVLLQLESQLAIVIQQAANFDSSAGRTIQLNSAAPALSGAAAQVPEFASVADSLANQRWSEITLAVKTDSMKTQSNTTTSFSQSSWGCDFFFGSAWRAKLCRLGEFFKRVYERQLR